MKTMINDFAKPYEQPEVSIVAFKRADVICTSGEDGEGSHGSGGTGGTGEDIIGDW